MLTLLLVLFVRPFCSRRDLLLENLSAWGYLIFDRAANFNQEVVLAFSKFWFHAPSAEATAALVTSPCGAHLALPRQKRDSGIHHIDLEESALCVYIRWNFIYGIFSE
jgi:hypothetical protein